MVRWWWVSFSCEKGFLGAAIIDGESFDEVIANDATNDAIHLQVTGSPSFNVVPDPTGNLFHGTNIDIRVTEFVN
ncbi:hypothetical protein LCGC14_1756060 [marine sediment metagenome]|uniref:Uncharacterized protein n=1 Tax=marine sediment metagenome TaxID=412755 RepID=A0A0F9HPV6_9ZZZZ